MHINLKKHKFILKYRSLKTAAKINSVYILFSELKESVFTRLDLVDYFSLADNALMDMQRHVLRHLPHVKTLDLRRNKIAKLTEEDFQVTTAY